jgi:hypothetical protein
MSSPKWRFKKLQLNISNNLINMFKSITNNNKNITNISIQSISEMANESVQDNNHILYIVIICLIFILFTSFIINHIKYLRRYCVRNQKNINKKQKKI